MYKIEYKNQFEYTLNTFLITFYIYILIVFKKNMLLFIIDSYVLMCKTCPCSPHIPLPYPCVCLAKLRTTASTASLRTAGLLGLDRPRPADMSTEPNPLPMIPDPRLWSWSGGGGGGGPGEADTEMWEPWAEERVPVTPGRRDRRVPVALAPYPIPGCKRWWRRDSIVSKSDAKETNTKATTARNECKAD